MAEQAQQDKNFRYIVRVANTDLNGKKGILVAMRKIKGVGLMYGNFACRKASLNPNKRAGNLTPEEIKRLEDVILNPLKFDAPEWMLNRRKDPETGQDMHLITTGLALTKENDLKLMKKTKSYKGMRHQAGLTVRGQKTKANFRRNKGKASLGVKKKTEVKKK